MFCIWMVKSLNLVLNLPLPMFVCLLVSSCNLALVHVECYGLFVCCAVVNLCQSVCVYFLITVWALDHGWEVFTNLQINLHMLLMVRISSSW